MVHVPWPHRGRLRTLRCAALTVACAGPTHASAAAPATPTPAVGLRKSGGFLTLAPGVGGLLMGPETFVARYTWGLDGGYHFARGRRFALQLGAYFEHAPHPKIGMARLGGVLRIGGGNERVFGYGLVQVGADITRWKAPYSSDGHEGEPVDAYFEPQTFVLPGVSGGGGVMLQFHRIVGVGGELAADLALGNGVIARARLYLALKF